MPKKFLLSGAQLKGFRASKRLHGTLFSLAMAPLSDSPHARIAFIVSKKSAPLAHTRNLVKRRARAASLSSIARARPMMYVLTAKKEAVGASFAAVRADIALLFEKSGAMAP